MHHSHHYCTIEYEAFAKENTNETFEFIKTWSLTSPTIASRSIEKYIYHRCQDLDQFPKQSWMEKKKLKLKYFLQSLTYPSSSDNTDIFFPSTFDLSVFDCRTISISTSRVKISMNVAPVGSRLQSLHKVTALRCFELISKDWDESLNVAHQSNNDYDYFMWIIS